MSSLQDKDDDAELDQGLASEAESTTEEASIVARDREALLAHGAPRGMALAKVMEGIDREDPPVIPVDSLGEEKQRMDRKPRAGSGSFRSTPTSRSESRGGDNNNSSSSSSNNDYNDNRYNNNGKWSEYDQDGDDGPDQREEEEDEFGDAALGLNRTNAFPVGFVYSDDSADLTRMQRPFEVPPEHMRLHKAIGMEWGRRNNLHLIDDGVVIFAAGNTVQTLDLHTHKTQVILGRNESKAAGVGSVAVHPNKRLFAVAETGTSPRIFIYSWPALQVLRILRGGTEKAYASVCFDAQGGWLASVGSDPDYTLTLWDWENEMVVLRTKAFSQEVFQVTFSPFQRGKLVTSGQGHIRFWRLATTFTGLKLQGTIGKFGTVELSDIGAYAELHDGKVLSGTERGSLLLWDGAFVQLVLVRRDGKPCHDGSIEYVAIEGRSVITAGEDGYVRRWSLDAFEFAEPADDLTFPCDPAHEVYLGAGFKVTSMLRCDDHWLIQNGAGGIYKLPFTSDSPELLYETAAGKFTGIVASTRSHTVITTTTDGGIRLWDCLAGTMLRSRLFSSEATAIAAVPLSVDDAGVMVAVGFADGVLRILERAVSGLGLVCAIKPHRARITGIAFSPDGNNIAISAADHTIFFLEVGHRCTHFTPVGYIQFRAPLVSLQWSPDSQLLLFASEQYIYQVRRASVRPQSQDTYLITHYEKYRYTPVLKLRRKVFVEEDGEEGKDEGKELAVQEEVVIDPRTDHISCVLYTKPRAANRFSSLLSNSQNKSPYLQYSFFVTFANTSQSEDRSSLTSSSITPEEYTDANAKYETLYECTAAHDEPVRSVPLGSDFGIVSTLAHSPRDELLLIGSRNGSIQVRSLSDISYYFSSHLHDGNYGQVTGITTTFDEKLVISVGADGHMFIQVLDVHGGLSNVDRSDTLASKTGLEQEQERSKHLNYQAQREQRLQDLAAAREAAALGDMGPLERFYKKMEIPLPPPSDVIEDDRLLSDVLDLPKKTYSLEEEKKLKDHDEKQAAAERNKEQIRAEILQLRKMFEALLKLNQALDPDQRLPRSAFELDSRVRAQLENEVKARVQEVQQEMAWETEKHEIQLRKLRNHFLAPLEVELIGLKAFRSGLTVHSFRAPALPPFVVEALRKIRDFPLLLTSPADSSQTIDDALREAFPLLKTLDSEVKTKPEKAETTRHGYQVKHEDGKNSTGPLRARSGPPGGNARGGWNAAHRREERERRKMELLAHEREKPDGQKESEKVKALVATMRANIGDYSLKGDPDYRVPEHQRITVERKRTQLVLLRESIYTLKQNYNRMFLELRAHKALTIAQARVDGVRIAELNRLLGIDEPVFMPEIDPREWPEKRDFFTEADLEAFRLMEEEKKRKAVSVARGHDIYGGMEDEPSSRPGSGLTTTNPNTTGNLDSKDQHGRSNTGQTGSTGTSATSGPSSTSSSSLSSSSSSAVTAVGGIQPHAGAAQSIERIMYMQERCDLHAERLALVPPSELELAEAELQRKFLEDERADLIDRVEFAVSSFDDALSRLRLEKTKLDADLKSAALKLVTMYEELNVLRAFEEEENAINGKIARLKALKAQVSADMLACQRTMTERAAEAKVVQEAVMQVEEQFSALMQEKGIEGPILKDLQDIFSRSSKRGRRRGAGGRGRRSEGDDEFSGDDDVYGRSDSDDDSENDEDGCPAGCDPGVHTAVLELRSLRLTRLDEVDDKRKAVEELRKLADRHQHKEHLVDRDLVAAQAELETFQSEKQRALNHIEVTVPLRLSQLCSLRTINVPSNPIPGTVISNQETMTQQLCLPKDLSGSLVFTSKRLADLEQRIRALAKSHRDLERLRNAQRKTHTTLLVSIEKKAAEVAKERAHCEEVMMLKFGQKIDLEVLARVGDDSAAEEHKRQVREAEIKSVKRLADCDKRVAAAKDELSKVTLENTRWLERVAKLTQAQYRLEHQLNKSTKSVHVTDSSPVDEQSDAEKRELLQVVQAQEKELDALKAEIHVLRSKGGRLYVPQ